MKFIYNVFLISLLLLSTSNFTFAQTGKISGKVYDSKTSETLIGVKVVIEGTTTAATTDYEGKFTISNLLPGTYNLVVSYISYSKKIVSDVEVKKGEVTSVSISMVEATKTLGDIVIRSEIKKESANALLIQQKNATTISDGLSIETIRKTPDRNTSDVLKRVSGATIQDNKYAIIRGLPDRYNAAFVNGSPLPSSEPDRKAFAFDIFPANLLDNIVIVKSATPDLSGEFAGGLILIKTKDIPDQNFYNLSFGTSINTLTTFNKFNTNVNGSNDFLGIDDGSRKLPGSFPDNKTMKSLENSLNTPDDLKKLVAVAKPFNNNFKINENASMRPAYSIQFSMGHLKKLKTSELGSVFSLSMQNTPTTQQITRKDYDATNNTEFNYLDEQNTINTLNGFLWNISLKNKNNKISFKNLLNINSNDQTTIRSGQDLALGFDRKFYFMMYTQNVLNSHQIGGEHFVKKYKSKINWTMGYSGLNRETPDFRRVRYQKITGDETSIYQVPLQSNAQADVAGRFFSTQNDKVYNAGVDISRPLNIKKFKNEIKFGGYAQYRDRVFNARQLGYAYSPSKTLNLDILPIDQIFANENISSDGYIMKELTSASDAYTASSNLYAGYLRFDSKITNKLKAVWGARLESYNQKINTVKVGSDNPFVIDTTVIDILPSINLIYTLTTKSNLRASYSQTVSRPEFRELAAFSFYDFNDNMLVQGKADLKRTKINNYDLRYEFYPTPAQIVSSSVFYKTFENPIEKSLFSVGPNSMEYSNVPTAFCYGVELDYKLNFGQLFQVKNQFLEGLNFIGNLAYIKSEVDVSKVVATPEKVRPLQGQSPYIINASLQYTNTKKEYGVSLSFNRIGERIVNVGYKDYASYWENPRSVIDLQINKTFYKKLDVRFGIRDLLAQNIVFYQNSPKDDNVGLSSNDNEIWNFKVGSSYSINLSYKF
jgi:hypothetical protein